MWWPNSAKAPDVEALLPQDIPRMQLMQHVLIQQDYTTETASQGNRVMENFALLTESERE